tara:strand:- start:3124 stop:3672 length:549 start_codon:yes stop_codon:yes gene_type:complete
MQLGSLRIVIASISLFIFGFRSLRTVGIRDLKWLVMAGLLSSFFPPFLFAIAQTQLDSAVTSIFNSTVPLLTTVVGITLFGLFISKRQVLGVLIGLFGTLGLIVAGMAFDSGQNYWYSIFILLSALGYALNINIIKTKLSHLGPLAVTTASFGVAVVPAFLMVLYSGFFKAFANNAPLQTSL